MKPTMLQRWHKYIINDNEAHPTDIVLVFAL